MISKIDTKDSRYLIKSPVDVFLYKVLVINDFTLNILYTLVNVFKRHLSEDGILGTRSYNPGFLPSFILKFCF